MLKKLGIGERARLNCSLSTYRERDMDRYGVQRNPQLTNARQSAFYMPECHETIGATDRNEVSGRTMVMHLATSDQFFAF